MESTGIDVDEIEIWVCRNPNCKINGELIEAEATNG
jgi:hypothetical protein